MITLHQKIFALIVCTVIFLFILELVRRRKLKEEYSWLWLLASAAMFLAVVRRDFLLYLSDLIGAGDPLTTIFLFGFLFLIMINIDHSVQISKHKELIKKLAQQISITSKKS